METGHLEIRTRLSAAVTTTQLLLEKIKKIQANNFEKEFFLSLSDRIAKYVIGLRPSEQTKKVMEILQRMEMSRILIQIVFSLERNISVGKTFIGKLDQTVTIFREPLLESVCDDRWNGKI